MFQISGVQETRKFVAPQETVMAAAAEISTALLIKAQKKMTIRQPTLILHIRTA